MRIEFGFVSICLSEPHCSPAGAVTVRQVIGLDPEARRLRLVAVARRNLENTLRVLWFLRAHDIRLYRMSAQLIPLATHEVTAGWAWWDEPELQAIGPSIGRVARGNGCRLSSHLPEVCGLTTLRAFHWTLEYLAYHQRLFGLLGELDETVKIILHVGGTGGDKKRALRTAHLHLGQIPKWAAARLVLENDDKSFTADEVLELAEAFGVPVAFDWHHHWCNHSRNSPVDHLPSLLQRAFALWRDRPPKVHVSSPRDPGQVRAHADDVDPEFVWPFLEAVATVAPAEVDVMVEAKKKDLALFRLREAVKARGWGNPVRSR